VRNFVEETMGITDIIHDGPAGIGIKPITEFGSKRLIREAIDYAIDMTARRSRSCTRVTS
jgi:isocitrate dehydrogenase (NADP) (EC 1.1.1.42)